MGKGLFFGMCQQGGDSLPPLVLDVPHILYDWHYHLIPEGYRYMKIQCWGGGSTGGRTNGTYPGPGGAGGAYSEVSAFEINRIFNTDNIPYPGIGDLINGKYLLIAPAELSTPYGTTNLQGNSSAVAALYDINEWSEENICVAVGGGPATTSPGSGRTIGCIGDFYYAGGNGSAYVNGVRSGAGGGVAGVDRVGGTASGITGGTGFCDYSSENGNGANGRNVGSNSIGYPGNNIGGGGGGSVSLSATIKGGDGAPGFCRITFYN